MAKCIEHGKDGFAISAWNPLLIKINEDMYAQLKQNFGDSVKCIYPGIYGDYGEACYITGQNPWMAPAPEHQHPGFWAGDDLAKSDFRAKMTLKYGALDALNAAWKTGFKTKDEIVYPKLDGTDQRRRALDFVNWYYDSMTDLTARICEVARKQFPDVLVAPKLGGSDENPMLGQDNSAIPKVLAKIGAGVRFVNRPGSDLALRRVSSACKFYGNRFETETSGDTNRDNTAKRLFIDASSGCRDIFEYPNSMIGVADIFSSTAGTCAGSTRSRKLLYSSQRPGIGLI